MRPRDVERFFGSLARRWPHRTECILVGGAAAALDGSVRPTRDVDFEVRFGGARSAEDPDAFASAVHEAERASGVEGQFTEDLSRWSQIGMPAYRGRTREWRKFGPITVRLLDPADYCVSKLRRGASRDFDDLILVARQHRVSWVALASRCAAARRLSPRSTQLEGFVKRVELIFRERGRELWGPRFDPGRAIALFRSRRAP